MKNAGIYTPERLRLAMLQVAVETGGFKSRVSKVNNMSGIKYSPKSAIAGEYDSGIKSPEGDNYSGYTDLNVWAKRYVQIVNRGSKPFEAATINDFAERLKKNKYFTAPLEEYKKALASWVPQIGKLKQPVLLSVFVFLAVLFITYTIINNGRFA